MPYCETCIYFGTDGDCDGPEDQWCELNIVEPGWHVGSTPACKRYIERIDEDDNW